MFTRPKQNTELLETINEVTREMRTIEADTEEYAARLDRLERLYKLRDADRPGRISPDTRAIVVGNLVGIAMIIHYERVNVIASKAMSFVLKAK